jgi:hypothetical protein
MSPEPLDYSMYFRSEVFIRAKVESYEVQGDGSGAVVRFRSTKTFRGPQLAYWVPSGVEGRATCLRNGKILEKFSWRSERKSAVTEYRS